MKIEYLFPRSLKTYTKTADSCDIGDLIKHLVWGTPLRDALKPFADIVKTEAEFVHTRTCARRNGTEHNNIGSGNADAFFDATLDWDVARWNAELKRLYAALKTKGDDFEAAHFAETTAPVALLVATAHEPRALKTWRAIARRVPEEQIREVCHAFNSEILAGEPPKNRGAALNARLRAR